MPTTVKDMGTRERLAWASLALTLLMFLVGIGARASSDREQFIIRLTLLENNQSRLVSVSETQVANQEEVVRLREQVDNLIFRVNTLDTEMKRVHDR